MASTLKITGPLRVGKLSADPSNPEDGLIYFNTASGEFRQYAGGSFTKIIDQDVIDALTAADIAFAKSDGNKKNIDAASDDLETAVDDLDEAIGGLAAVPSNYTPSDASIVADHLAAIDTALASAGGTTFSDSAFRVQDNGDATKQIALEASGITTATTRTITMPDEDVDLGEISSLRTLSGTSASADDLGTFTGATISDNGTIKAGMQELETAVELRALDADVIKKDGSVAFTADQSVGGNKLTSVADPTSAQDAATKAYVDAVAEGLKPKEAVRVATTAAGTLASDFENGDTVDGVTLATGDRILIKDQSTQSENGIYVVQASGAPVRATDFDEVSPIDEINGVYVAVQEGTDNEGKIFVQQGTVSTVGSDNIVFVFFNSSSALVGGDGIQISGSNISVDHDGEGLTFSANQLALELNGTTLSKDGSGLQISSSYQAVVAAKLDNIVEDTTPELGGNLDVGGFAIEDPDADLVLAGQNSVRRAKQASKSSFVEEEYIHSIALSGSQTDAVISDFTFAYGTYEAIEIVYKLKESTSNDIRVGRLMVVCNGTNVAIIDYSGETADTGIVFDAQINGANVEVTYDSGTNGATMRADVKKFLA